MAYKIITSGNCQFCDAAVVEDAANIFKAAIEYLSKSKAAVKIIDEFNKLKPVVKIHIATNKGDNKLWHEEDPAQSPYPFEHICWNPIRQVQCKGGMQSPAIGLIHEMGHAIQGVTNREFYQARIVLPNHPTAFVGKDKQMDFDSKTKLWRILGSVYGENVPRSITAWMHDVESNNITRHETPVVRELRAAGFKEAERAKAACREKAGIKECFYEDGGNSMDMDLIKGKAPDNEKAGEHRNKKVADMTWAERVSCAVFCPAK